MEQQATPRTFTRSESIDFALAACGAALAGFGLARRGRTGALLAGSGGALLLVSAIRNLRRHHEIAVSYAVTIHRPASELYEFWRDLSNVPKFFEDVFAVKILDRTHSEWVAIGPSGQRMNWLSERVEESTNRRIRWESTATSEIHVRGRVEFEPLGRDITKVRLTMGFHSRNSETGSLAANVFTADSSRRIREALLRFRDLMEQGRIRTPDSGLSPTREAI